MSYEQMQAQFYADIQNGFYWVLIILALYLLRQLLQVKVVKKTVIILLFFIPIFILEGINFFTHN